MSNSPLHTITFKQDIGSILRSVPGLAILATPFPQVFVLGILYFQQSLPIDMLLLIGGFMLFTDMVMIPLLFISIIKRTKYNLVVFSDRIAFINDEGQERGSHLFSEINAINKRRSSIQLSMGNNAVTQIPGKLLSDSWNVDQVEEIITQQWKAAKT